jgi:hypothetical protein
LEGTVERNRSIRVLQHRVYGYGCTFSSSHSTTEFEEGNYMAQITGRLIMNLLPNGSVTIAFMPNMGGENMNPIVARNIDGAQDALVKAFGQTPVRAGWIRADLEREGTVQGVISIDLELAATLCVTRIAKA